MGHNQNNQIEFIGGGISYLRDNALIEKILRVCDAIIKIDLKSGGNARAL
jgi:hypothetical protein